MAQFTITVPDDEALDLSDTAEEILKAINDRCEFSSIGVQVHRALPPSISFHTQNGKPLMIVSK